jgi:hypothetical protein
MGLLLGQVVGVALYLDRHPSRDVLVLPIMLRDELNLLLWFHCVELIQAIEVAELLRNDILGYIHIINNYNHHKTFRTSYLRRATP